MNIRNIEAKVAAKKLRLKNEYNERLNQAKFELGNEYFLTENEFYQYEREYCDRMYRECPPTNPDQTWEYIQRNLSDICNKYIGYNVDSSTYYQIKSDMERLLYDLTTISYYDVNYNEEYKEIRVHIQCYNDPIERKIGVNFN